MKDTSLLTTHIIMTLVIILSAKPGVASVMLFLSTRASFINCLDEKINRIGEQSARLYGRI
jgi:hypothetical protein